MRHYKVTFMDGSWQTFHDRVWQFVEDARTGEWKPKQACELATGDVLNGKIVVAVSPVMDGTALF